MIVPVSARVLAIASLGGGSEGSLLEWVAYRRALLRFSEYLSAATLDKPFNWHDTLLARVQTMHYPQECRRLENHLRLRSLRTLDDLMRALNVDTVEDLVLLPLSAWRVGLPLEADMEAESSRAAHAAAALATKPDLGRNANRGMRCPRCKGSEVDSMQMQTRSADESMTTKFICLRSTCQHQWRVN